MSKAPHSPFLSLRTNGAMRLVRIAIREGRVPSVRLTRDAIAQCAYYVEEYGDAGAANEAFIIAPFAVSRAQGDK